MAEANAISDVATDQKRREALRQLFPTEHVEAYARRFSILLGLSTLIAFCGLQADSTAVVIGAMLVAPLMEPILSMAGAMVMDWRAQLLRSAALVGWGAVLVVGLAALLGLALPDRVVVVDEVAARTNPNLLDLGVALGAGAAGAYSVANRIGSSAAGVAIAVALVPPLTVVGITIEEGRYAMAGGALLLFGTNLLAILLTAACVLLLSGVTPKAVRMGSADWVTVTLSTTLLGVVLIAVPLTASTVYVLRQEVLSDAVLRSINDWKGTLPYRVINVELAKDAVLIELATETPPRDPQALADRIATYHGKDIELQLRWSRFEQQILRGAPEEGGP